MLSQFSASSVNLQPIHSLNISPNIVITLEITIPQHSVLFLRSFMLTCGQLNYPRFRSAAQNLWSRSSDTIWLPIGRSGILSLISVFDLFVCMKDCGILFNRTNSACYFQCYTITRRVPLLGSRKPIYPLPTWKYGYPALDSQPDS